MSKPLPIIDRNEFRNKLLENIPVGNIHASQTTPPRSSKSTTRKLNRPSSKNKKNGDRSNREKLRKELENYQERLNKKIKNFERLHNEVETLPTLSTNDKKSFDYTKYSRKLNKLMKSMNEIETARKKTLKKLSKIPEGRNS